MQVASRFNEGEGIRAHGKAKLTLVEICSGETKEIADFRNVVHSRRGSA